jgi:hypothetical protein
MHVRVRVTVGRVCACVSMGMCVSSSENGEIASNALLSISNVGAAIVVYLDTSLSDCGEGG